MFPIADCIALLESGVPHRMLMIAADAYRAVFENEDGGIDRKTQYMMDMAQVLGIPREEYEVDGALSKKKLRRAVSASPVYRKSQDWAWNIIGDALHMAGFTEGSGENEVYRYDWLRTDMELQGMLGKFVEKLQLVGITKPETMEDASKTRGLVKSIADFLEPEGKSIRYASKLAMERNIRELAEKISECTNAIDAYLETGFPYDIVPDDTEEPEEDEDTVDPVTLAEEQRRHIYEMKTGLARGEGTSTPILHFLLDEAKEGRLTPEAYRAVFDIRTDTDASLAAEFIYVLGDVFRDFGAVKKATIFRKVESDLAKYFTPVVQKKIVKHLPDEAENGSAVTTRVFFQHAINLVAAVFPEVRIPRTTSKFSTDYVYERDLSPKQLKRVADGWDSESFYKLAKHEPDYAAEQIYIEATSPSAAASVKRGDKTGEYLVQRFNRVVGDLFAGLPHVREAGKALVDLGYLTVNSVIPETHAHGAEILTWLTILSVHSAEAASLFLTEDVMKRFSSQSVLNFPTKIWAGLKYKGVSIDDIGKAIDTIFRELSAAGQVDRIMNEVKRGDRELGEVLFADSVLQKKYPNVQFRYFTRDSLREIVARNPMLIVQSFDDLSQEQMSAVTEACNMEDVFRELTTTEEGILLLIKLIADGGWQPYAKSLINSRESEIRAVISSKIPPDERPIVIEKLGLDRKQKIMTGTAGDQGFTVVNNLRWGDFYNAEGMGVPSPLNKSVKLYTRGEVEQILANITDQWKLPSAEEVTALSKEVAKRMGFAGTGLVDGAGRARNQAGCFCWREAIPDDEYEEGYQGYQVQGNGAVDEYAIDEVTDKTRLALRLVQLT